MTVIKIKSLMVETDGIKSLAIKNNLLSYIPRILAIAIFAFAVLAVASTVGQLFDMFNEKTSFWQKAGASALFLFMVLICVMVAGSALKLVTTDDLDDESLTVVRWALGISATFVLLGAALNYSFIAAVQRTGGSFASADHRAEYVQRLTSDAGIEIAAVVILCLTYVSLRLLDRKDIHIVRADGSQKVANISKDTADRIRDAIPG
jgi:hypothetical protein